ncbi:MAG: DNA gyrase inhibitor YacG [Betaproteobacteria bacterium]|nr:MAG: DNA gyrase inhibitor YacG [Betaproteobacteria bacterium]
MTQSSRTVNCPRCGKPLRWGPESPFRPFCSERCKMIDLGAWANEEYRVAVKGKDDEPDGQSAESGSDAP